MIILICQADSFKQAKLVSFPDIKTSLIVYNEITLDDGYVQTVQDAVLM